MDTIWSGCREYSYSIMERVKGIEPSPQAWEAGVLPLNYTRVLEVWTAGVQRANVADFIAASAFIITWKFTENQSPSPLYDESAELAWAGADCSQSVRMHWPYIGLYISYLMTSIFAVGW